MDHKKLVKKTWWDTWNLQLLTLMKKEVTTV